MNYTFEKNKLYNFLGSHLVDVFKKQQVFIAGGLITSLFSNRGIKDVDVYFRNEDSLVEIIEEVWDDSNDWINALTEKALLVRIDDKEVQFIHFKYFENANDIFSSFDYTVCMGAFDFKTEEFIMHDDFLKHNSQRLLKFNKNTDYPIVSLLRVHKYKEKGYSISKPEFLRIVLQCMTLKIDTIDELKKHLGGMYGINYDKLIQLEPGEEFSIELIIDKIADLSVNEDYFKEPEKIKFNDVEQLIEKITKRLVTVVTINDETYRVSVNRSLKEINYEPENKNEIDGKQYIAEEKFYKFVDKKDGKYFSFFDKSFEYKIEEEATPKAIDYLYFNQKFEINQATYKNDGGVLIEATIPYESFHTKQGNHILTRKCFITREVPKEEYEKWMV